MKQIFCKIILCVLLGAFLLGLTACGKTAAVKNTTAQLPEKTETVTDSEKATDTTTPATSTLKSSARVLFEDDFDGTSLDINKWECSPEESRQGGACVWSKEMVRVFDGDLHLSARWDSGLNKVVAGSVWSNPRNTIYPRFTAVGGYYEARIKFPVAKGTWGAFWIMAGDVGNVDGKSSDGAEIDIAESIDCSAGTFNHAVHWDGYADSHQQIAERLSEPNIYDGEYHVFGFERAKGGIYVFYVDGKETWRTMGAGLCAKPGYMILSMESGFGYGSGTAECIGQLPVEMCVDYVRVYAKKP